MGATEGRDMEGDLISVPLTYEDESFLKAMDDIISGEGSRQRDNDLVGKRGKRKRDEARDFGAGSSDHMEETGSE